MEYRLLEKTELWVKPVKLAGADLNECARVIGRVLGLDEKEIMVSDAIGDRITFDLLVPTVKATQIVAKEREMLEALGRVEGVTVTSETGVHSEGVLGLISVDEASGGKFLNRSLEMREKIAEHIAKRAVVLATGGEVLNEQIKDTNTPFLLEKLREMGYEAQAGPVIADDWRLLGRAFLQAAENAFGLVITTGGIGAEGKDQTLEALLRIDGRAQTPYVLKFRKGEGRHAKDGVRIGVGRLAQTRVVCLPGPHDEVELLWPVLAKGLTEGLTEASLADALAVALREKFLSRGGHHPHVSKHEILGS